MDGNIDSWGLFETQHVCDVFLDFLMLSFKSSDAEITWDYDVPDG